VSGSADRTLATSGAGGVFMNLTKPAVPIATNMHSMKQITPSAMQHFWQPVNFFFFFLRASSSGCSSSATLMKT